MAKDRPTTPTSQVGATIDHASPAESVRSPVNLDTPPGLRRARTDSLSSNRSDAEPFTMERFREILDALSPDDDSISGSSVRSAVSPVASMGGLSPIPAAESDDDSLSFSSADTETTPSDITWVARVGRASTPSHESTEETKENTPSRKFTASFVASEETKTNSPIKPLRTR